MASLYDAHKAIVKRLRESGETEVFNPTNRSFLHGQENIPNVYVKGRPFPSEKFISGSAFKNKDGTYSILHDHLAYQHHGFRFDELGLCDPVLWYENSKQLKKPRTHTVCPKCKGTGRVEVSDGSSQTQAKG